MHLLNASPVSQRLHILPPTTPSFKIFYNKKGVVAPGMTQPVTIVFEPKEYRYHYDFFRLHKGNNDNVVIPFHGYPIMNKFVFPEKINFGHVPLTKKISKIIPLKCEVPIAFEYEIKVNKEHKDITIYPLKGVIPASGVMEVHVEFAPQSFGTKTAEISVSLEQFNFHPIICQIQGYSQVNYYREEGIKQASKRVMEDKYKEKLDKMYKLDNKEISSIQQKKDKINDIVKSNFDIVHKINHLAHHGRDPNDIDHRDIVPEIPSPKAAGSGSVLDGAGEAIRVVRTAIYREKQAELRRQQEEEKAEKLRKLMIKKQKQANGESIEDDEDDTASLSSTSVIEIVDGVKIPENLDGVQATNFMLTQEPGKLKPKDLQKAIENTRRTRAEQKQQQEELAKLSGTTSSPSDGIGIQQLMSEVNAPCIDRQLKELVFSQEMADLEKREIDREFKASEEWIGEIVLIEEEINLVKNARQEKEKSREAIWRDGERKRTSTKLKGPFEPLSMQHRAITVNGSTSWHQAVYDPFAVGDWRKRSMVARKFIYNVSKVICRQRVTRRLKKINEWINQGSRDRESVKKRIAAEWEALQNGSATVKNEEQEKLKVRRPALSEMLACVDPSQIKVNIRPNMIAGSSLPLYNEERVEESSNSNASNEVDNTDNMLPTSNHNIDNNHLEAALQEDVKIFPLKKNPVADTFGYKPLPMPEYTFIAPVETHKPLKAKPF